MSDNPYINPDAPWTTPNGHPLSLSDHAMLRSAAVLNITADLATETLAKLPANASKKTKRRAMDAIEARLPQIEAELHAKAVKAGVVPSLEQFTREYVLAQARAEAKRRGVKLDEAGLLAMLEGGA